MPVLLYLKTKPKLELLGFGFLLLGIRRRPGEIAMRLPVVAGFIIFKIKDKNLNYMNRSLNYELRFFVTCYTGDDPVRSQ